MLSTMNVQFIVQGTGEQQYEEMFNYFHGRYPQKLGVYIGYSEENAHEIYAGCDALDVYKRQDLPVTGERW